MENTQVAFAISNAFPRIVNIPFGHLVKMAQKYSKLAQNKG